MNILSEYFAVALASTIKFAAGPILGVAMGLSWLETTLSSAFGMMATVIVIIYGSDFVNKTIEWSLARLYKVFPNMDKGKKPKKLFTRKNRIAVKVKVKLGLWGLAFLTPFLFTPIIGTILAISFKYSKLEILTKMLVCSLVAGFIQTIVFEFLKKAI